MSNKNIKVLLADDDEDYIMQQRTMLESKGFEVHEANNRKDAEALIDEIKPDLAIVDLMMEDDDDGFVLCYKIKKALPNTPVILVTAVASETGMEFEATTGEERAWIKADAVLAKPVRFAQLEMEIERLLGE